MDMTKVYFKADNEDQARVIWGLLYKYVHNSENALDFNLWREDREFLVKDGLLHGGVFLADKSNRTEASVEDLFKFAMNGWKEPWEVAEEGYRIATEKERRDNAYPTDCEVRWLCVNQWYSSGNDKYWNPEEFQCTSKAFAVPEDYRFKKPEKEIEVNGKMYSESTIQNALREYVK
jgi:hypothetical protein